MGQHPRTHRRLARWHFARIALATALAVLAAFWFGADFSGLSQSATAAAPGVAAHGGDTDDPALSHTSPAMVPAALLAAIATGAVVPTPTPAVLALALAYVLIRRCLVRGRAGDRALG